MKTTIRILLLLSVLCLSGCKTKEKVTERQTETAQASSVTTQTQQQQTELQGQTSLMAESTQTQASDSVVERFRERIVTDSAGRVLLHDVEHSREHYKGKAASQKKQTDIRDERLTAKSDVGILVQCDSTYNGGTLKEVTVVKKKSWRWLWFVSLLSLLFIVGFVISKIVRK